ncbi:MAG: hypothetical protein WCO05_01335, partial [Candidatus Moraniibacteriota bacterium]
MADDKFCKFTTANGLVCDTDATSSGTSQWVDGITSSISYAAGTVGIGTTEPLAQLQIGSGNVLPAQLTSTNLNVVGESDTSNKITGLNGYYADHFVSGQYIDMSNYASNNAVGLFVNVKQTDVVSGIRKKSGIVVDAYQPSDNGGEVSGIYVTQGGGGNGISVYKADGPSELGQTRYPNNGYALEVVNLSGNGGPSGGGMFLGVGTNSTWGQAMRIALGGANSRGIVFTDVQSDDARPAIESVVNSGNLTINGPNTGQLFQLLTNGSLGLGAAASGEAGTLRVVGSGSSSIAGNVGIGTTSPTTKLQVGDGSTNLYSRIYGSVADIYLGQSTGTMFGFSAETAAFIIQDSNRAYPLVVGNVGSQPVVFGTNGSEQMRISSNGNVGIGTTNPFGALDVASTTKGVVIPRMTKAQRDAISAPVAGTMVYQTDNTPGLRMYDGANWMRFTETAD